jgi:hypothetical protein
MLDRQQNETYVPVDAADDHVRAAADFAVGRRGEKT